MCIQCRSIATFGLLLDCRMLCEYVLCLCHCILYLRLNWSVPRRIDSVKKFALLVLDCFLVIRSNEIVAVYCIIPANHKGLSALFSKASTPYNLRDHNKLIQPLKRTTTYGIKSLAYYGTHLWNSLPHDIKGALTLNNFETLLRKWAGPTCGCSVWNDHINLELII